VSKDDRVPDGGPSDPDVDIVGASGSVPASPEPSLKEPFRGFLAGDDGAKRFFALKRNPPAEDPPAKETVDPDKLMREVLDHVVELRALMGEPPLAMTPDEIHALYIGGPPSREIIRKMAARLRPGGPPKNREKGASDAEYLELWQRCVDARGSDERSAIKKFFLDGQKKPPDGFGVLYKTLQNAGYRLKLWTAK
jgi:hypothetical protein